MIKYIENKDINFIKWDHCINNALNGNIFAYSWYLDILCENWSALILGDYEYVMPLVHKKKFGKKIIFSPKFGIRLGIYTNKLLSKNIITNFFESIPSDFLVVDFYLNKLTNIPGCKVKYSSTYELDLIQTYKKISTKYNADFRDKLQIAKKNHISVLKGLIPNDLINFSFKKGTIKKPHLNNDDRGKLRMIIAQSFRYGLGEIYGAYTAHNNLCAVAYFIFSKHKIFLLYSAINKEGLKSYALHAILDKFLLSNPEKKTTLNIENIALEDKLFYASVGAKEYRIKQFYINKLPWIYKLFFKK